MYMIFFSRLNERLKKISKILVRLIKLKNVIKFELSNLILKRIMGNSNLLRFFFFLFLIFLLIDNVQVLKL